MICGLLRTKCTPRVSILKKVSIRLSSNYFFRSFNDRFGAHAVILDQFIRCSRLSEMVIATDEFLLGGKRLCEEFRHRASHTALSLMLLDRNDRSAFFCERPYGFFIKRFYRREIEHLRSDARSFKFFCRHNSVVHQRTRRNNANLKRYVFFWREKDLCFSYRKRGFSSGNDRCSLARQTNINWTVIFCGGKRRFLRLDLVTRRD